MKTFISKTWMLWAYILIEVCFQFYLRHSLQYMSSINIEALELVSRLLFAFSTMVFLWSGLQIKRFIVVPLCGVLAFALSSQVYPLIHRQLSDDMQSQMLNKFVWGASNGMFTNPEHLNTAMTLAFSVYDKEGQSVASKLEGNNDQFHDQLTRKVLPEAMLKGAKQLRLRKKSELAFQSFEILKTDNWQKIENDPRGRNLFLMRAVVKGVNEKFVKVIEAKTGMSISNRQPLGTSIKMSKALYDPESFKRQFNEWILSEWLVNHGISGGKEFALKALIMLPLGFFFSALGILLNLSAIMIKGTTHISKIPRAVMYGVVASIWAATATYGITAIPTAMTSVQGIYWLTPVFAVTKLLGVVPL